MISMNGGESPAINRPPLGGTMAQDGQLMDRPFCGIISSIGQQGEGEIDGREKRHDSRTGDA